MNQLLTAEREYLSSIADAYQTFRNVVDEVLRAEPFNLIHDDHVGDVAATLARLEPRLVEDAARYVAEGNDAAAFTAVSMSLHILAKADAHIMRSAPLWQDLYKLACADTRTAPIDPQDNIGKPFNNKIGNPADSELYFWIRDRTDDIERRRWQYRLLHKRDAKKAKA